MLFEAGIAFPDPRGRNSVPTGQARVAEDLLSSPGSQIAREEQCLPKLEKSLSVFAGA